MAILDENHGLLDPNDRADVELVHQAIVAKQAAKQRGLGHKLAMLGLSLAMFWFFQQQFVGGEIESIAALVLVLVVHEAGHVLAMRMFGYTNLAILFIPGVGAAATGRKLHTTATERAMVSLMGPLPGLLFSFGAAFFIPYESEFLANLLVFSLLLNGFNLLPLLPLDGGHYLDESLFARWPVLRQIIGHLSGIALALIGWQIDAYILMGIGIVVALSAGMSRIWSTGAEDLRAELARTNSAPEEREDNSQLEPMPEQIPEMLIPTAMQSVNLRVFSQANARPTPASYASMITTMWERVGKVPPPVGTTIGLLIVYLASVGVVIVTAGLLGLI